MHGGSADVLDKVHVLCCAGYRDDPGPLRQDPCQRKLRRSSVFSFGPVSNILEERQIYRQCIGRKSWQIVATIRWVETAAGIHRAGKKAASNRAIGHKTDAEFLKRRKYPGFWLAPPDCVFTLNGA